jgi:iron complex outermembrane recepter protein
MFKSFTFFFSFLWMTTCSFAQSTIRGQVSDPHGKALSGASVFIRELSLGDASGNDGSFTIPNVPPGTWSLVISYVGFEDARIPLTISPTLPAQSINVTLKPTSLSIEPLIVRATRATERTPMSFSLISKTDIDNNNIGLDAPYLFRWTPSAVETSDAGAGIGYTGIRIRGSDPTRINVTINGIPLNDAESQIVYWVNMPDFISSTDNVQIQRGVGASTNGPGAFGASINLQTSQTKTDPFASIALSGGSFNTFRRNVSFGSGRLGSGFSIEGRLSQINSDGYIDRASSDLQSWFVSAGWTKEKSLLKLNVFSGKERTYQAWYGVPADNLQDPVLRRFNPAGTEKPGEPYADEADNYQQTHYQLIYNVQLNDQWNLNLAGHYTRGMGYYEQYKANQLFSNYGLAPIVTGQDTVNRTDLIRQLWLDNHFYGGVFSLQYQSKDQRLESILGGALSRYDGDHFGEIIWAQFAGNMEKNFRFYDNNAIKTDVNVYNKWNYRLGEKLDAYLDLQFRSIRYRFLGYNILLEQVTQDARLAFFNPKFGFQYNTGANSQAYASFAVGNREPNRNDFTENTPDTRPLPERLYNTEIGYRAAGAKGAWGINAYHMYYRNQLVLNGQINQVGEYVRINVDKSYRMGLEMMGRVSVTDALQVQGNYTISRNRVNAFTEYLDTYDADFNWLGQEAVARRGTALAFSPAHIANAELDVRVWKKADGSGKLNATLMGKWVSRQFIDNSSDVNNTLPAYNYQDLRLRYVCKPRFGRELALQLLVQNILNTQFVSNAWSYRYLFDGSTSVDQGFFPQAGRNYMAGFQLNF